MVPVTRREPNRSGNIASAHQARHGSQYSRHDDVREFVISPFVRDTEFVSEMN